MKILFLVALAITSLTAILTAGLVVEVSADTGGGVGIEYRLYPTNPVGETIGDADNFIFDLEPGKAIREEFTIANLGDGPVSLKLYPASTETASTGGLVVASGEPSPGDLAYSIRLDQGRVVIEAQSSVNIGFELLVSPGISAGKHAAAIIAENEAVTRGTGALSVSTVQRAVVLVLGTAPGELVEDLSITDVRQLFSGGFPTFEVDLTNDGTTYVFAEGNLSVEDTAGVEIGSSSISLGMFMPRTAITHRLRLNEALPGGDYTVNLDLVYGSDRDALGSGGGQSIAWDQQFRVTNTDLKAAAEEAGLLALARGEQAPVIIIDGGSSGSLVILLAGTAMAILLIAGAGFMLLLRRREDPLA